MIMGELLSIADANRKLAVRALHASMGDRAPAPLEEYSASLAGWEVIPIADGQEVIGAVIRRRDEVHVGMTRTPRGAARWIITQVLTDTIARYGWARTRVGLDNPAGLRFCARLGFNAVDDGGYDYHWPMICTKPRHARARVPA